MVGHPTLFVVIIKFYIMIMTLFSPSDIIFGYHSWISFLEMITELLSILRIKRGTPLVGTGTAGHSTTFQLDGNQKQFIYQPFETHIRPYYITSS